MLKLVTQFDDPEMKPSVATPTCGPCCCCSSCCCVATAIATGVITSRNIAQAVDIQQDKVTKPIPVIYKIVGTFSFPLAIAVGIIVIFIFEFFGFLNSLTLIIGPIVSLVTYSSLMFYVAKKTRLNKGLVIGIIIFSVIAVVIEFFWWFRLFIIYII